MTRLSLTILNDAGLLRAYVVEHYGHLYAGAFGCSLAVRSAERLVRRLSRLTGLPVASIAADIAADYESL